MRATTRETKGETKRVIKRETIRVPKRATKREIRDFERFSVMRKFKKMRGKERKREKNLKKKSEKYNFVFFRFFLHI